MEIRYYSELDYRKLNKKFDKVVRYLQNDNFSAAEIKKMANSGYYRAKLDEENRLLFQFARYEGRTYILLLEVIHNHDYDKSRFLRGAKIDESKLLPIPKPEAVDEADVVPMAYVNGQTTNFHLLDKVISFDDDQQEIFRLPTPMIVIGSAGSGKTALTLEKIKTLKGNILYVTLSPYLVENSSSLYYSFGYENERQEIDFLSFREYVETLRIPEGRELTFPPFDAWFIRHRNSVKFRDSYRLYEEFKGVLTGMRTDKAYLSREDYLALGVRQSVFLTHERPQVYDLFEKYLAFLKENSYYDLSMVAYHWQEYCKPKYDFIIVDEVQDLTNSQLSLILQSLKQPGQFILCGDSNQIVHPNFFSWANVKTMFYTQNQLDNDLHILRTNYRNSPQVTEIANRLLKVKNARFGSIDRESTYLVNPVSDKEGEVVCLSDSPKMLKELNQKTRKSNRFAVVVMSNTDKAKARKLFQTPLLFSVQEAKGLEYENIILVNFIHHKSREFREVTQGVTQAQVDAEDIRYARAKDKTDKSLDAYKFYVNSFYVAMTRAVRNLYVVESSHKHPLLSFLGLTSTRNKLDLAEQQSSLEEWQEEARKLELQGKDEQAELIRKNILKTQPTPWTPITLAELRNLKVEALNPERFNKKAKDRLFTFALVYNNRELIQQLSDLKYRKADRAEKEREVIMRKLYQPYVKDNLKKVQAQTQKYGLDFRDELNMTPLLVALKTGATTITDYLLTQGARTDVTDNLGMSPFLMALQRAHSDEEFMAQQLPGIYHQLRPESIKVKVDQQLVKISARSAEYFLLHNFLVAQPLYLLEKDDWEDQGLKMDDVLRMCEPFPVHILPEYRQKRQYLNSILAKNEIDRDDPYNKKLFLRLVRGVYVLNPDLEVLVAEDEWMNVYDIMLTEKMTRERNKQAKKEGMQRLQEARMARYEKQEAKRRRKLQQFENRWGWERE